MASSWMRGKQMFSSSLQVPIAPSTCNCTHIDYMLHFSASSWLVSIEFCTRIFVVVVTVLVSYKLCGFLPESIGSWIWLDPPLHSDIDRDRGILIELTLWKSTRCRKISCTLNMQTFLINSTNKVFYMCSFPPPLVLDSFWEETLHTQLNTVRTNNVSCRIQKRTTRRYTYSTRTRIAIIISFLPNTV